MELPERRFATNRGANLLAKIKVTLERGTSIAYTHRRPKQIVCEKESPENCPGCSNLKVFRQETFCW